MRAQKQSHPLTTRVTGDVKTTEVQDGDFIRDVLDRRAARGNVTGLNLARPTFLDSESADALEPLKEPRSFARFLGELVDRLIVDFALAAAAAHPETYILLSEINNQEKPEKADSDRGPRNPWPDARSFPRRLPSKATGAAAERGQRLEQPRILEYPATPESRREAAYGAADEIVFPNLIGWLWTASGALFGKMKQVREVRRSIAELQSLDDHMLRDIGLTRYEVERGTWRSRVRNKTAL